MKARMTGLGASALVLGNLVGAGILALPISLGMAGFVPSVLTTVVYSALMLFSAVVLGRVLMDQKSANFDYPTLFARHLGPVGKWVAIVTNAIILYGYLIAYVSGGAKILADATLGLDAAPVWLTLVFAAAMTCLTQMNLSAVDRYNRVLVLGMVIVFAGLVGVSCDRVSPSALGVSHWRYFTLTIPLTITAAHFHNIIPVLAADLGWDGRALGRAMLTGMLVAVAMNLAWIACGIGCLPRSGDHSLISAFVHAQPATVPMGAILRRPVFSVLAAAFSLAAIVTSYLANGIGLQNFVRDLLENTFRLKGAVLVRLVTFVPPTLVAVFWPDVFITALNIVGGIGIVTLFGILPCILGLRLKGVSAGFRALSAVFLVLSVLALATVVGGLCGSRLLSPDPQDELRHEVPCPYCDSAEIERTAG